MVSPSHDPDTDADGHIQCGHPTHHATLYGLVVVGGFTVHTGSRADADGPPWGGSRRKRGFKHSTLSRFLHGTNARSVA